jgi:hypothetical protein
MIFSMLTNEEVINNVDMDENASAREKNLAMRLANALDAMEDLEARFNALQSLEDQVAA